jgi:hypothetical protein
MRVLDWESPTPTSNHRRVIAVEALMNLPETTADNLHNLWRTEGFPHRGWQCLDVVDLNPDNAPHYEVDYGTCDVCGHYPIRFVHVLLHDEWSGQIEAGCVCAEKLTGDYISHKDHERDLRRRAAARANWLKRRWRISAKGNKWLNVDGHHVTVFLSRHDPGYRASVDGAFSPASYPTEQAAMMAAFDYVQSLTAEVGSCEGRDC